MANLVRIEQKKKNLIRAAELVIRGVRTFWKKDNLHVGGDHWIYVMLGEAAPPPLTQNLRREGGLGGIRHTQNQTKKEEDNFTKEAGRPAQPSKRGKEVVCNRD